MVREKSKKKWYGEYTDPSGRRHRKQLAVDKASSLATLTELTYRAERKASGLYDPFEEHAKRPLVEHLTAYRDHCLAKGGTKKHVRLLVVRLEGVASECRLQRLADIDGPKIAAWLAKQRNESDRFSAQTNNYYLTTVKAFCNWLVANERLPRSPLAALKPVDVRTDRRHDRRALTDEEFERLLAAAASGNSVQGMSGPERAMLYLTASWTGFRRRELASLTAASLDLDGESPSVRLRAAYSKRRREDTLPLHPILVERLLGTPSTLWHRLTKRARVDSNHRPAD
ncbi:MAG: tyrosine-type recombinase/integrase [Lacipirellulaceae bacterium]